MWTDSDRKSAIHLYGRCRCAYISFQCDQRHTEWSIKKWDFKRLICCGHGCGRCRCYALNRLNGSACVAASTTFFRCARLMQSEAFNVHITKCTDSSSPPFDFAQFFFVKNKRRFWRWNGTHVYGFFWTKIWEEVMTLHNGQCQRCTKIYLYLCVAFHTLTHKCEPERVSALRLCESLHQMRLRCAVEHSIVCDCNREVITISFDGGTKAEDAHDGIYSWAQTHSNSIIIIFIPPFRRIDLSGFSRKKRK